MKKCKHYRESEIQDCTYDAVSGEPLPHVVKRGRCNGTFEQDFCDCAGDPLNCDFYPDVKDKAKQASKIEKNTESEQYSTELNRKKD